MWPGKLNIVLLIVATAVVILCRQVQSVARARADVGVLRAELARLTPRVARVVLEATEAEARVREHQEILARLDRDPARGKNTGAIHSLMAVGPEGATDQVELSKVGLSGIKLKPFTDEYQVSEEAAAVLGLSASERKELDQAFRQVIQRHEQLDLARVKSVDEHLSQEPGRKTTFKVAAYPEEGQALAQAALTAVTSAIGSNRTQTLMGYADLGSLSADGFEPFGRTEKTITFLDQEATDGSRGDCRIIMKVVDTATGFTLTTSYANTDDAIPKNWRHLIENIAPAR